MNEALNDTLIETTNPSPSPAGKKTPASTMPSTGTMPPKSTKAQKPEKLAAHEIITPEGVRLTVILADRSSRLGAAMIDISFIFGGIVVLALLAIQVDFRSEVVWAYVGFFAFLARVLYFPWFELALNGQTPGKKLLGLRVIGRLGAPLEAQAVLARNLAREVEMWLPLTYLFMASDVSGFVQLATVAWVGCFAAIPFFSEEKMRGGDVLAGTWVIVNPKAVLERDLLQASSAMPKAPPAALADVAPSELVAAPLPEQPEAAGHQAMDRHLDVHQEENQPIAPLFTPPQLDAYGVEELNTLADLLYAEGPNVEGKVAVVAAAIAKKIDHDLQQDGARLSDKMFLQLYYRAARAKMETDAQWGRLRQNKFDRDRSGRPRGPDRVETSEPSDE